MLVERDAYLIRQQWVVYPYSWLEVVSWTTGVVSSAGKSLLIVRKIFKLTYKSKTQRQQPNKTVKVFVLPVHEHQARNRSLYYRCLKIRHGTALENSLDTVQCYDHSNLQLVLQESFSYQFPFHNFQLLLELLNQSQKIEHQFQQF